MTNYLADIVSFLNPCQNGNVRAYVTTKELKKKQLRQKEGI